MDLKIFLTSIIKIYANCHLAHEKANANQNQSWVALHCCNKDFKKSTSNVGKHVGV